MRKIVCNGRFTDILEAYPVGIRCWLRVGVRTYGKRISLMEELQIYTGEAYQVESLDLVWVGD